MPGIRLIAISGLLECLDLTLKINNENYKYEKRILGLKIDTNRISWAIVEENISDLPQFPF
jgi:hypothetical protein